jgi:hypothetical protein
VIKIRFVESKLRYRQFKRFLGRRSRFGVGALISSDSGLEAALLAY